MCYILEDAIQNIQQTPTTIQPHTNQFRNHQRDEDEERSRAKSKDPICQSTKLHLQPDQTNPILGMHTKVRYVLDQQTIQLY